MRAMGSISNAADRLHMKRALELAGKAKGKTEPNPTVGCVLVLDGNVVGEGYHPRVGRPHAEVYALRAAGKKSVGSTAYVSLEPCAHFGRTPPCAYALLDAGVKRVVIGYVDPNPLVEGKGMNILLDAGVQVEKTDPDLEEECRRINLDFFRSISGT